MCLEIKARGISCSGWEVRSDLKALGYLWYRNGGQCCECRKAQQRLLILKMDKDNGLLNVLTAYAPHLGKPQEKKENSWNELFHLLSCIPQNEMVVLAGDTNEHVGSNCVGYDGMHGGYGYGDRNANGSRILEFPDGLNLIICNTLLMKHESKLVTYVAGSGFSEQRAARFRRAS